MSVRPDFIERFADLALRRNYAGQKLDDTPEELRRHVVTALFDAYVIGVKQGQAEMRDDAINADCDACRSGNVPKQEPNGEWWHNHANGDTEWCDANAIRALPTEPPA